VGVLDPFRFVLISIAGWMNQQQQQAIDYLREENLVLVRSKYSCGEAVVPEEAAQTLPAFNTAGAIPSTRRLWEEQDISLPLMVALAVEVRNILVQRPPE
jgi:hypothetical protein